MLIEYLIYEQELNFKGDKSDLFCPLLVTVTEEGSEQAAVGVVDDGDQEMLVEFKCIWEL